MGGIVDLIPRLTEPNLLPPARRRFHMPPPKGLWIASLLGSCLVGITPLVCVASADNNVARGGFSEAIEDNSFLIEEAYNQENRVVQHITTVMHLVSPQQAFDYTFTQEWPVFSALHQVSYTVPYSFLDTGSGPGDAMIHYRYQLFYKQHWAAVAPRLSVIFPTGNEAKGLSSGVMGFQFNLPVSKRVSDPLVLHLNAGVTVLPRVVGVNAAGVKVKRTLISYNLGGSVVWLAEAHFNLMLEYTRNANAEIDDSGRIARSTEILLNPGIRFAIDIRDLQVVPGLGIPIKFGSGNHIAGAFFYLSFEHPF